MKLSFLSLVLISVSPFSYVYAQETQASAEPPPQVESTRTRITCSSDLEETVKFVDGNSDRFSFRGKASESLRTTWKLGNKEHRFSEFKGFNEAGDVVSLGYSMTEYEVSEANGLRTEKSSGTQMTQYLQNRFVNVDGKLSRIRKRSFADEYVYAVDGNKLTLVKATSNGQAETVLGAVTYITQDSPTKRTEKLIGPTGTRLNEDGSLSDILKDETVCVFETL